jgi:hypothetical protein
MRKKDIAPVTAKTTLRLSGELLRAAKHRAVDENGTLQSVIEHALVMYLRTPVGKEVGR